MNLYSLTFVRVGYSHLSSPMLSSSTKHSILYSIALWNGHDSNVRVFRNLIYSQAVSASHPPFHKAIEPNRFQAVQLLSHVFKEHQANLVVAIHCKGHVVLCAGPDYSRSKATKRMGFEVNRVRIAGVTLARVQGARHKTA